MTTEAATAEPSEGPSPARTEASDLRSYEELDERTLAQLAKAPDDHIDRLAIVYGAITQLDAAAGKCIVRVSIADSPQDAWYDCEHNSVSLVSDGEADCLVLDPLRRDETSSQRRRRLSPDPRPKRQCPVAQKRASGLLCSGRIRAGEVFSSAPPHLVQIPVRRHA